MPRPTNIELTYRIVETYQKQFNTGISPLKLINYIKQRTGVTHNTALDYIEILNKGCQLGTLILKIKKETGLFFIEKNERNMV